MDGRVNTELGNILLTWSKFPLLAAIHRGGESERQNGPHRQPQCRSFALTPRSRMTSSRSLMWPPMQTQRTISLRIDFKKLAWFFEDKHT